MSGSKVKLPVLEANAEVQLLRVGLVAWRALCDWETSTRRLRYGACWNSPPWAPSPRCRHGAHCPAGGASLTRSGSLRRRGEGSLRELRRLLPPRASADGGPEIRQDPRRRPAEGRTIGNGPRACAGYWQSLPAHAGPRGVKLPPRSRPRGYARSFACEGASENESHWQLAPG
jgi:hypothetical protein